MERKYTKGPWRAAIKQPHQDFVEVMHKDGSIGAASGVVAKVTVRQSWHEEQIANANLIAAAPCLLEALEVCRKHMYEHASNTDDGAFDKLCAAIDRATGQKS